MLGLIDFIGIFSSSEWIDIVTGILIPTFIIRHSSQSAKKQFKEQNRRAENQLKEQNRISEAQLKEQLETQNELAVKKEKRMLATQIRLSKLEEGHNDLIDYITLANSACIIILNFNGHSLEYTEYYRELTAFNSKASHIDNKMSDFCYFFPNFKEDVELIKSSYKDLAKSIPHTFTEIKQPEKFKDVIIDNKLSFSYAADVMAKKLSITKLAILSDLESTL